MVFDLFVWGGGGGDKGFLFLEIKAGRFLVKKNASLEKNSSREVASVIMPEVFCCC